MYLPSPLIEVVFKPSSTRNGNSDLVLRVFLRPILSMLCKEQSYVRISVIMKKEDCCAAKQNYMCSVVVIWADWIVI